MVQPAGPRQRLREAILAEQARWPLWCPVLFGAGIGFYFALPAEPPSWLGVAAALNAGIIALLARGRPAVMLAAIAALLAALGFAMAQLRTAMVAAPVLERRLGPVEVEGRVADIESKETGFRVVLDRVRIEGLPADRTPARVRLRIHDPAQVLSPGKRIAVRAIVMPPPGPAVPGGFDFQRQAYFQRLGAVGFAIEKSPRLVEGAEEGGFGVWLESVREDVFRRITSAVPGPAGTIAAALITGKQGAIPEDVLKAMRDSGLAHLLAISGQNISLVAGFVFLFVRGAGALVPAIALRHPIKKWAAVAAFASALLYLLLSGAGVPTQRSVAMIGLVLLAVLVDRSAISMRPLAWAALAILLIAPEAVLGASFQLSFAAVLALIAIYERLPHGIGGWAQGDGARRWSGRALRYLGVVVVSSLVAGLATAPFAAYHFNRLSVYGLVANLIAVPLTGVWIMPAALGVLILLPFGLEAWALAPMGWGIEAMIAVAREVASWPSATLTVPRMPQWGLLAVVCGGLWLCVWTRRWRLAGLAPIVVGVLSIATTRPPDMLVSGDGRLFAMRSPEGELVLSSAKAGAFTAERWLHGSGLDAPLPWTVKDAPEGVDWLSCDRVGCLYRAHGRTAALVLVGDALPEDCAAAELVVSLVYAPRACRATATVIDMIDLRRNGAHAAWLGETIRVESARSRQGDRPWTAHVRHTRKGGEAYAAPSAGAESD